MTQTPLSVVTNTLGDYMEIRVREGMPSLIVNGSHIVGTVKDCRFEGLIGNADRLRQQLDYLVFVVDNLSGVSIDTLEAHRVLDETRMDGN